MLYLALLQTLTWVGGVCVCVCPTLQMRKSRLGQRFVGTCLAYIAMPKFIISFIDIKDT